MGVVGSGILLSMLVALGACAGNYSNSSTGYGNNSISSSGSLPVEITILSSNGTDLTPSMPILHSHIPLPALRKRSNSTSIRDCPTSDETVSRSWCQHSLSAQSFEAFCKQPGAGPMGSAAVFHYTQARCGGGSICVGSEEGDGRTPLQAHCVSTTQFVPIGRTHNTNNDNNNNNDDDDGGQQQQTSIPIGVVTAGFSPASSSPSSQHDDQDDGETTHAALEAVLTHADKRTSLFASSHVMQAQWYNATGGIWRTAAGGSKDCVQCASLRLEPFPRSAQRVKVDVVLPEEMPVGLLWLASYRYVDY